jgi:hypothetical protein
MVNRLPWFERGFPTGLPAHLLPVIVERLRGTPARLADRLAGVPDTVLTRRGAGSWSIQENVGHLLDLEPLWRQRVSDLARRRGELAEADLTNRRTHEANHNAVPLAGLSPRSGRPEACWSASSRASQRTGCRSRQSTHGWRRR